MNVRPFIAEIKKRPALWDQNSRHYHNKQALNDGWLEIARKFQVDVIVAKQKWKNLRDTFRVELKKSKKSNGSDNNATKSLWAYYDDMYFLKDTLKTRKVQDFSGEYPLFEIIETDTTNIKTEITVSPSRINEEDESNIVIENVSSVKAPTDPVDTTNEQILKKGVKRRRADNENSSDDDNDDDLLFFRSLLPFVKRLGEDKKLLFRLNVQQMVYNQLYDNSDQYNH